MPITPMMPCFLEIPDGEDICNHCGAKMHIEKYDERKVYILFKQYVKV